MPAKRKIQKEDILKASISIISHEGLNALNARKLAKKLGCSTQPLFYIYENMDDLKKDVIDEIVKIFDREVLKSETGSLEYKDIGINYIRFAKESWRRPSMPSAHCRSDYRARIKTAPDPPSRGTLPRKRQDESSAAQAAPHSPTAPAKTAPAAPCFPAQASRGRRSQAPKAYPKAP